MPSTAARSGILAGDIARQARHRHEHRAAGDRGARSPRRCAPRARPSSSAPSAAPSARRATASSRPRGRRGGGFRPRQAAARADVPPRRACRPGRRRRQHEARDQPAADGLLPGAGRGLRALPTPRHRSRLADGALRRHLGRPERPQGARRRISPRRWPARIPARPPSTSTRSARTSPPWWPRARRARASTCRWWSARSPIFDEAAEEGWGKRDGSASLPAYWPTRQA